MSGLHRQVTLEVAAIMNDQGSPPQRNTRGWFGRLLEGVTGPRQPEVDNLRTSPKALNELGNKLLERYTLNGDREALDQAIYNYETAWSSVSRDQPEFPRYAQDLGIALWTRYAHDGRTADLDRSITLFEEAVAASRRGTPGYASCINSLGVSLRDRYLRNHDRADLERASEAFAAAVAGTASGSAARANSQSGLGAVMTLRYMNTNDLADLDRAIEAFRGAADAAPDSPTRVASLSSLGASLHDRYDRTGSLIDLEQAIGLFEEAAEATPIGSQEQLALLSTSAGWRWEHYEQTRDPADLGPAVRAFETLVAASPPDASDTPTFMGFLGNVLRERYLQVGDTADLERAITILEHALAQAPADSPIAPQILNDLGTALWQRYVDREDFTDLERAIASFEQASTADTDRPSMELTNLAAALTTRYELLGHIDDLERAIALLQQVLAQASGNLEEEQRSVQMTDLALALRARYFRSGDLADLEQAIQLFEEVVRHVPRNSQSWPDYMNNLGLGLWDRYARTHELVDLDRAVEALSQALTQLSPNAVNFPRFTNNLGLALRDLYSETGDMGALRRAIKCFERSLDSAPTDPHATVWRQNLGVTLRLWAHADGNPADLDRSISLQVQALNETAADSLGLAGLLNELGTTLQDRYGYSRDYDDLRRATEAYRRASIVGIETDPESALAASRNWGRWAAERQAWPDAAEAYRAGLRTLQRLLAVQVGRGNKESWLRESFGFSAQAAYALAMAGDPRGAIVALERGRALLVSEALERTQADLDGLKLVGRIDLEARYRQAASVLGALEPTAAGPESRGNPTEQSSRLRAAHADLDAVLAEIRTVPGYERFLDPANFDDVAAEATKVPILYIVAGELGGLGLMVRSPEVTQVSLPDLTMKTLQDQVTQYGAAYARHLEDAVAFSVALNRLTRWLGDAVMQPLLATLASAREAVIVPVGLLGLLPLHAAWIDDRAAPTGRRYVLDHTLVTYAPNARTLRNARRVAEEVAPTSILAVDDPRPVQAPPLVSASHEAAAACATFAPAARRLSHEHATRHTVATALNESSVLHFACHGYADLATPLNSGLVLANDEPLTLRDLFALRLRVRLAVLSACESGLPGTDLPDEVVGLPTGLLQAGAAGIVASLWAVSDTATMFLMIEFYDRWRQQGLLPAEALRQAQRWLRDSTNKEKLELFEALLDQKEGTWLPRATVEVCWEALALEAPDDRSFADPASWAAFSFLGA